MFFVHKLFIINIIYGDVNYSDLKKNKKKPNNFLVLFKKKKTIIERVCPKS